MKMNVTIYANKTGRWVKRKTIKEISCGDLYDVVGEYNDKYSTNHFVFPAGINPADYPELSHMEEVALSHIQHYHNDFYMWDTQMYFNYSRKGLWCLRNTGTNFIPMGEPVSEGARDIFSEEREEIYNYHLKHNKYFYFVDKGGIKRLSRTKAAALIEKELKKISQKSSKIA